MKTGQVSQVWHFYAVYNLKYITTPYWSYLQNWPAQWFRTTRLAFNKVRVDDYTPHDSMPYIQLTSATGIPAGWAHKLLWAVRWWKERREGGESGDIFSAQLSIVMLLFLCYRTASCLLSYLINHASPILSNELSNTSVWMLWNSSLFNLLHFIIVWSCGHYYKVWQLLGIIPHCWLNAKPLLYTAYTQTLSLFSQTIFLLSYFLLCSFFHTLSSYLLSFLSFYLFIFLSLTHLIAGSYPIGGYLDHILLDDKPGLV